MAKALLNEVSASTPLSSLPAETFSKADLLAIVASAELASSSIDDPASAKRAIEQLNALLMFGIKDFSGVNRPLA